MMGLEKLDESLVTPTIKLRIVDNQNIYIIIDGSHSKYSRHTKSSSWRHSINSPRSISFSNSQRFRRNWKRDGAYFSKFHILPWLRQKKNHLNQFSFFILVILDRGNSYRSIGCMDACWSNIHDFACSRTAELSICSVYPARYRNIDGLASILWMLWCFQGVTVHARIGKWITDTCILKI